MKSDLVKRMLTRPCERLQHRIASGFVGTLIWTVSLPSIGLSVTDTSTGPSQLPKVSDGFDIELMASEPLVRNPCSMAFDTRGRLFIGMGPQYRHPEPDTPGDSVMLLLDTDGDDRFDERKEFATGLNCIQGMAWNGRDLWLANAPDLTVVRDTDGDDVADVYVKVYTDLGNIEHGLCGLVWGPDGRLYMSKGNSKGLTQPGRIAPQAFRELWDVAAPEGTPEIPAAQTFRPADYKNTFQDPRDNWGREGGVLVCDETGQNLEIISRGFRNPWDINFDDAFNWQGTDNDQHDGDRLFTPFRGSHYGWGHSWSAGWTGHDHLPTAPITGKVFVGSGTGIVFYDADHFPESHRGVWFFNDWLRKTTFMYRPRFDGALIQPTEEDWTEFVRGGEALFKPTDIEVGPDGKLYIFGWGTDYGVKWDDDHEMANEGRVYRVSWNGSGTDPDKSSHDTGDANDEYQVPFSEWNTRDLIRVFRSSIPARRVRAQRELLDRGQDASQELRRELSNPHVLRAVETWVAWTLGRLPDGPRDIGEWLQSSDRLNLVVQGLRILGHRARAMGEALPMDVLKWLEDSEPRVRLATVLAIQQAGHNLAEPATFSQALRTLAGEETDRVVFYAAWQTQRRLIPVDQRKRWLAHDQSGIRLAGLLSLAEDGQLTDDDVLPLISDPNEQVRAVAALWTVRKQGNSLLIASPPSQEFEGELTVNVTPGIKPSDVRYTTDGSTPNSRSARWEDDAQFDKTTELKLALFAGGQQVGTVAVIHYRRLNRQEESLRNGLLNVTTTTGQKCRVVNGGMASGEASIRIETTAIKRCLTISKVSQHYSSPMTMPACTGTCI